MQFRRRAQGDEAPVRYLKHSRLAVVNANIRRIGFVSTTNIYVLHGEVFEHGECWERDGSAPHNDYHAVCTSQAFDREG